MTEEAPTTTRPARGARRTSKAAPAKAVAAKVAAPVAEEAETTAVDAAGNVNRLVIALVPVGDTKTYSRWAPPEGSGCVGTFYAPLGATEVRVAIKGATE
jgi:hypothetical protein